MNVCLPFNCEFKISELFPTGHLKGPAGFGWIHRTCNDLVVGGRAGITRT